VLLFAAFRVITARNPVHAALYLVLAFFQAAMIWMLLKAEFLAITLVLVYVGAVMVLFLFVVMMLDINIDSMRQNFWRTFRWRRLIGALIALEMAAVLMGGFRVSEAPKAPAAVVQARQAVEQYSNTKELGKLLYTQYLYPLEIAAVILLVAMIAAIALTLRERKDSKHIDPSQQVRVRRATVLKWSSLRHDAPRRRTCGRARRGGQGMTLTLGHFLSLGAILFALSVIGIFLNRKNLIVLLMAIELMLLAVNMNFVAFSHYLGDMHGQVFVFFILTVAAAESAIGLAILVLLFRNKSSINVDELNTLKG
jgi:NADH-quinone oxidoreductase subunit J